MKQITVGKNDDGQRLDKFLQKAFPNLPQSMMQKAIRKKDIKINGKRAENSIIVRYNDTISLFINDDFLVKNQKILPKNVPPDIDTIYEDDFLILINKKCGLVVHEDNDGRTDTLANRLIAYLAAKGEYEPENEQSFIPALCNRLDRNTSGIVIAAKTASALRIMNEKIRDRELSKKYLCITAGVPKEREATLRAYHVKDAAANTVYISDKPREGSREILTRYRVLRDNANLNLALLEVELLTGRTHQIRAHLAHIGCPILGDGKYGRNAVNRAYNVKTQALCAYKLKFSFTTPAGELEYLRDREFTVPDVWFENKFL